MNIKRSQLVTKGYLPFILTGFDLPNSLYPKEIIEVICAFKVRPLKSESEG